MLTIKHKVFYSGFNDEAMRQCLKDNEGHRRDNCVTVVMKRHGLDNDQT